MVRNNISRRFGLFASGLLAANGARLLDARTVAFVDIGPAAFLSNAKAVFASLAIPSGPPELALFLGH
jgi:hypothetical protein